MMDRQQNLQGDLLLAEYHRRLVSVRRPEIPERFAPTAPSLHRESSGYLRQLDGKILQLIAWVSALRTEKIERAIRRESELSLRRVVATRPQIGSHHRELSTGYHGRHYGTVDNANANGQPDHGAAVADHRLALSAQPSQAAASHAADDSIRTRLSKGEGIAVVQATDKTLLSDYQLAIRESLNFFQMQEKDVLLSHVPGRKNKPLPGQIGLRCRYCEHISPHRRGGGAIYFPGGLSSVYQAAQNIATNHLLKTCRDIPDAMKERLLVARTQLKKEPRRSGGNSYWMETSRHLGLEDRQGYRGVWVKGGTGGDSNK